jgi:hypothetical protein
VMHGLQWSLQELSAMVILGRQQDEPPTSF